MHVYHADPIASVYVCMAYVWGFVNAMWLCAPYIIIIANVHAWHVVMCEDSWRAMWLCVYNILWLSCIRAECIYIIMCEGLWMPYDCMHPSCIHNIIMYMTCIYLYVKICEGPCDCVCIHVRDIVYHSRVYYACVHEGLWMPFDWVHHM